MIIPKRPNYISVDNWNKMSRKERDFIHLLGEKKWTRREIKRTLYITSDVGYRKLKKRVRKYINGVYSNN